MFDVWNVDGVRQPYVPGQLVLRPRVSAVDAAPAVHRRGDRLQELAGDRGPGPRGGGAAARSARVARDIMSSPVVTLAPDVSVEQARQVFADHRFRHVPVRVGDGPLVGIVSDRGLFWHGAGAVRVRDVMATRVLTARPEAPIREIARTFVEERIGAMPIVDGRGVLAGILTRSDILRMVVRAPIDFLA